MSDTNYHDFEVICDITNKELPEVPDAVLKMHNLKMLYLDRNKITFLPDCMFEALPNLTWLDLRENLLESLPRSIGTHTCLENILLQNNKITHLPNELCRLSTLSVLQLSGNPLVYPPQDVIDSGLDDIMVYLQREFYQNKNNSIETPTVISTESTVSDIVPTNANNRTESGTIKLEVLPTLFENNLAERILAQRQRYLNDRCSRDKVHKVIKSNSKTSVQSYWKNMNVKDYLPSEDKVHAEQVKQAWLKKLKELVSDQERILQQEKAMGALKNWRKQQSSQIKKKSSLSVPKTQAPYDTNPVYNAFMSRDDVSADVNATLLEQAPHYSKTDVDDMIKDIMIQLQNARENLVTESNPEDRLKNAEEELKLIVAVHKKVSQLQKNNFF